MPLILLKAWGLARRLNLSQIALVVAIAFALMFRAQLGIERRHSGKLSERVNELRAELDRITVAKDEQADRTARNIEQGVNYKRQADRVAERIEAAPLPGNCRTPEIVMGADL